MSKCKTVFFIWFHGQAVKTSPSHGENRGSIPLGTVHTRSEKISFFVKINKLLSLYFVSAFQIHCPRTVKNALILAARCASCICMAYFFCAPLHLHSVPVGAGDLSDGGLIPTTDTDLFLATCRGGSHLTSDVRPAGDLCHKKGCT